jgi:hypothetical protein
MRYTIGGQSPHISKREGNVEPEGTSIAALPAERRSRLIATTVRMERERIAKQEARHS